MGNPLAEHVDDDVIMSASPPASTTMGLHAPASSPLATRRSTSKNMKNKKKSGMNKHHHPSSPILSRHGVTSSDSEDERHNVAAAAAAAAMQNMPPAVFTGINGFLPGEGAYREVAAYFLDHDRFAGVPQTALLKWDKPSYEDDDEEEDEHGTGFTSGDDVEGQCLEPGCAGDLSDDEEDDDDEYLSRSEVDDDEEHSDFDDDGEDEEEEDEEDDRLSCDSMSSRSSCSSASSASSASLLFHDGDVSEGCTNENGNGVYLRSRSRRNGKRGVAAPQKRIQTKKGAFQVYVPNVGDADDFGPGVFDKDQVQRIAVLDIRTVNHDRHGGNILITENKGNNNNNGNGTTTQRRYNLVPIDHGYILPDSVHNVPWPVWMDWPCVREPLTPAVKQYVQYLDADRDVRLITTELNGVFRPGALHTLKVATALLQKGVAAGLTLFDIGLLLYARRDDPHDRSELDKILSEAQEAGMARSRHLMMSEADDHGCGYDRTGANGKTHGTNGHGDDAFGGASTTISGNDGGGTQQNVSNNNSNSNNNTAMPMPLGPDHRRHQSSNAICDALALLEGRDHHRAVFVDEFVVRYATRKIQELVNSVAAAKASASVCSSPAASASSSAMLGSSSMARTRPTAIPGGLAAPKSAAAYTSSSLSSVSSVVSSHQMSPTGSTVAAGNNNNIGSSSSNSCFRRATSPTSPPYNAHGHVRPSFLARARSIPDFCAASIGVKPVHAILDPSTPAAAKLGPRHQHHPQRHHPRHASLAARTRGSQRNGPTAIGGTNTDGFRRGSLGASPAAAPQRARIATPLVAPTPTPASSPPPPMMLRGTGAVAGAGGMRPFDQQQQRAPIAMRSPPIRVPINDDRVVRIALPSPILTPTARTQDVSDKTTLSGARALANVSASDRDVGSAGSSGSGNRRSAFKPMQPPSAAALGDMNGGQNGNEPSLGHNSGATIQQRGTLPPLAPQCVGMAVGNPATVTPATAGKAATINCNNNKNKSSSSNTVPILHAFAHRIDLNTDMNTDLDMDEGSVHRQPLELDLGLVGTPGLGIGMAMAMGINKLNSDLVSVGAGSSRSDGNTGKSTEKTRSINRSSGNSNNNGIGGVNASSVAPLDLFEWEDGVEAQRQHDPHRC